MVYINDSTTKELGYKLIDCDFVSTAESTQYAFMIQDGTNCIDVVKIDGCTFTGYTRGINIQVEGVETSITNNTITSSAQENDRGAIQLTDAKSFVVTGNTINVNGGNAFWFHSAATNGDVTYNISNNNINLVNHDVRDSLHSNPINRG